MSKRAAISETALFQAFQPFFGTDCTRQSAAEPRYDTCSGNFYTITLAIRDFAKKRWASAERSALLPSSDSRHSPGPAADLEPSSMFSVRN
jgi:hypothetical protein